MIGKISERIRCVKPEGEVRDDVLEENDRRRQSVEHLHFGVDQQLQHCFDVLRNERPRSKQDGRQRTFRRQELLQRPDIAELGDGVRIFMGVGHAGVKGQARELFAAGADHFRNLRHPVVGGAHEGGDALVVRGVEDLHDGAEVLEAHLLAARLLLGHVVHAEELVVAEQNSIQHHSQSCKTVAPRASLTLNSGAL